MFQRILGYILQSNRRDKATSQLNLRIVLIFPMPRGLLLDLQRCNRFYLKMDLFYKQREGSQYWINKSTGAILDINFHGKVLDRELLKP